MFYFLQGIAPPVSRSEDDFDAGAKYHVAADVSYIRYFVAHILEYQFYRYYLGTWNTWSTPSLYSIWSTGDTFSTD